MSLWLKFGVWFAAMVVNRVAAAFANRVASNHFEGRDQPLPDLLIGRGPGTFALPVVAHWWPDVVLLVLAVLLFCQKEQRLHNFFDVCTPAMALRALVVCTTFYPTPLIRPPHMGYGAYDMMFSGHTVLMLSAARTGTEYAIATVGMGLILAARQHYTADVVVAAAITLLIQRIQT